MILLDRDGVLNALLVDPEHGTIDSPLHPGRLSCCPACLSLGPLTEAGYGLAIVSNQPAWAKGKTSWENLEAVHAGVVMRATRSGGRILSSHLCLHRREDDCDCRKPKTGLLREAFTANPGYDPAARGSSETASPTLKRGPPSSCNRVSGSEEVRCLQDPGATKPAALVLGAGPD